MMSVQSEQDRQDGSRSGGMADDGEFNRLRTLVIAPLLLVRMLSQTEFGVYKQVFQILTSTITALNLQVAATAYYFMPRAPEKKLQVTVNVLAFYGALGALIGALFIIYPECALLVCLRAANSWLTCRCSASRFCSGWCRRISNLSRWR